MTELDEVAEAIYLKLNDDQRRLALNYGGARRMVMFQMGLDETPQVIDTVAANLMNLAIRNQQREQPMSLHPAPSSASLTKEPRELRARDAAERLASALESLDNELHMLEAALDDCMRPAGDSLPPTGSPPLDTTASGLAMMLNSRAGHTEGLINLVRAIRARLDF
ncbi:hypothetical protein D3C81_1152160 [compost metagenome]